MLNVRFTRTLIKNISQKPSKKQRTLVGQICQEPAHNNLSNLSYENLNVQYIQLWRKEPASRVKKYLKKKATIRSGIGKWYRYQKIAVRKNPINSVKNQNNSSHEEPQSFRQTENDYVPYTLKMHHPHLATSLHQDPSLNQLPSL